MSVIVVASSLSNCREGRRWSKLKQPSKVHPGAKFLNSQSSCCKLQHVIPYEIWQVAEDYGDLRDTFTRNLLYYCLILPIKRHQGHQFWSSCHNLRQWDANRPVQGRFPQNEMSICCRDQWKKPVLYRNCLLALRKTSTYTYANIRICKTRIIFVKVERHWSSFHQSRYVVPSYPSIHPSMNVSIWRCIHISYHCVI